MPLHPFHLKNREGENLFITISLVSCFILYEPHGKSFLSLLMVVETRDTPEHKVTIELKKNIKLRLGELPRRTATRKGETH